MKTIFYPGIKITTEPKLGKETHLSTNPIVGRIAAGIAVLALIFGAAILYRPFVSIGAKDTEPAKAALPVERFLPGREFELQTRRFLSDGGRFDTKTLITRFLDASRPISERLQDARRLAQIGTPAVQRVLINALLSETSSNQIELARAITWIDKKNFQEALVKILETGNDYEAAAAIRALAAIGGEESYARLGDIINDPGWPDHLRHEAAGAVLRTGDDRQRASAIRGMSAIATEAETESLASILHDPAVPQSLRVQAAVGLGKIASPRAGDELIAAFSEFADEDVQEVLLGSLGHFPFTQIAETWKTFLADPTTTPGLRAAAAEALSNSSADAVPFLASLASDDREADVREMAAWALSTQEPGGALGPKIAQMLRAEPEPDVRRRLYESLLVQSENPTESVILVIEQEDDPAARIAAMNAAGDAVGRKQASSLAATFDSQMVPELQSVALGTASLNLRMRAVFALRRAGTPAAMTALANISQTTAPEIATAALHGLQTSR